MENRCRPWWRRFGPGLIFCRRYYGVNVYEGAVAVQKATTWQSIPQATFSIEFYTESLFHASPKRQLILLTQSVAERENINQLHPAFHAVDLQTLSGQREFLFVDSYLTPKSFQIARWATTHGFSTEKVGDYSEFYSPWNFTLVRPQFMEVNSSP